MHLCGYYYTAASFCTVYPKSALARLAVPVQQHQCIQIYASKAFAQLAIIRSMSCGGNCCPVVILLHFAFESIKYL